MSLRYALLGLLCDQPSSGYDLTQRFASGIGTYAWDAKHSQIYPELRRLLDFGLIDIAEEGPRGRKTYAITPAGREALREWLTSPRTATSGVRNEGVLRLFLLPVLGPDEARPVLTRTAEYAAEQVRRLTEEYDELERAGAPLARGGLAAQYGIRMYQATIDWAEWALAQLDREAAERDAT